MTELVKCPECGSNRIYKAGTRTTAEGVTLQRFKCQSCYIRFSETNPYKLSRTNNGSVQICAEMVKNLDTTTEMKTVAGEKNLVEYAWYMKRRGLSEGTIKLRCSILNRLQKKGANLGDPESVETVLATETFSKPQKFLTVNVYRSYAKFLKISWEPVRVRYEPKQPFIPSREELNALIYAAGKNTAAYLQVALETGARCNEICKIRWVDVDVEKSTISINNADKGSRNRTIKVTQKTIAMIQALNTKYDPYIFNPNPDTQRALFCNLRNKLAETQKNPRFKQIHLHSFRHFFACNLYFETKDIVLVKTKLGHRSIENTMKYTQLVEWDKPDNWVVSRPTTSQEEDQLIEAGFEYVRFDDKNQCPVYRKRK